MKSELSDGQQAVMLPVYSGDSINLMDPSIESIHLLDIGHALAKAPRYLGHTKRPYSVAEHSVRMWRAAGFMHGVDHAWEALLHDAAEAYLCDLPTMIKRMLVGYDVMEERIMEAVREKFGTPPASATVKGMDRAIRQLEINRDLFIKPETLLANGVDNGTHAIAERMKKTFKEKPYDTWGWSWEKSLEMFIMAYKMHGWGGME